MEASLSRIISRPPAPAACREWTIKLTRNKHKYVKYMGLWIRFSAGRESVFSSDLVSGKLKLVARPDGLELYKSTHGGWSRRIGRVEINRDGALSMGGMPLCDKNGPVVCRTHLGGQVRYVRADLLFPVLGRCLRTNICANAEELKERPYIAYGGKLFGLPGDPNSVYGPAARDNRIASLVLPDTGRIHFYERLTAPPKGEPAVRHIGWMPLDVPASGRSRSVTVADHLEEFRLKDLPVRKYPGSVKVVYRKVVFKFSRSPKSIYARDFRAGRIFLRTGYCDRVEIVRKAGGKEKILGSIAIRNGCLVAGEGNLIPLDQEKPVGFTVAEALEELGGQEKSIKLHPGLVAQKKAVKSHKHDWAGFHAFRIHFFFPLRRWSAYLPKLQAGQMACRLYRSRIEVGWKEKGEFHELGRVTRDSLLKSARRINLADRIPELGRIERPIASGRKLTYRSHYFWLTLRPGNRFFRDLAAGQLIFRGVGPQVTIFAQRAAGNEFIAQPPPAHSGSLAAYFRPADPAEEAKLFHRTQYSKLENLLVNGESLNRLKQLAVWGSKLLSDPMVDQELAVKILFLFSSGMEKVAGAPGLSADLKESLGREIIGTMMLALVNRRLAPVADALRILCRDAYAWHQSITRTPGA